MRISQADPALYLLDSREVEADTLPDGVAAYGGEIRQVVRWARSFLCKPHPDLGRDGPVCPYTDASLDRGLFWLTVCDGSYATVAEVAALVLKYRDWFLELHPQQGRDAEYKTIMMLLPEASVINASEKVDIVQASLKPAFTSSGLMLGQFHAWCDERGLWNRAFRPLRSPVPLLAIRRMVRTDAPFLVTDAASLRAYLDHFEQDVPVRLQSLVSEAAARLGVRYQQPCVG